MPYQWLPPSPSGDLELRLWPHRSLSRRGFVWFIGLTSGLIALPALSLIGQPVLWVMMPFLVAAVAAVWIALRRSDRDREILEVLMLQDGSARLIRTGPGARRQDWQAHSHWVRPVLHPDLGPVPYYLTLQGGPREVELGAFLAEDERRALYSDLMDRLQRR